jgi:hypothetical protein
MYVCVQKCRYKCIISNQINTSLSRASAKKSIVGLKARNWVRNLIFLKYSKFQFQDSITTLCTGTTNLKIKLCLKYLYSLNSFFQVPLI